MTTDKIKPTCPNCGEEIEHLNAYEERKANFSLDADGRGHLYYTEEGPNVTFECPKCEVEIEALANDRGGAEEFLRDGIDLMFPRK